MNADNLKKSTDIGSILKNGIFSDIIFDDYEEYNKYILYRSDNILIKVAMCSYESYLSIAKSRIFELHIYNGDYFVDNINGDYEQRVKLGDDELFNLNILHGISLTNDKIDRLQVLFKNFTNFSVYITYV